MGVDLALQVSPTGDVLFLSHVKFALARAHRDLLFIQHQERLSTMPAHANVFYDRLDV